LKNHPPSPLERDGVRLTSRDLFLSTESWKLFRNEEDGVVEIRPIP